MKRHPIYVNYSITESGEVFSHLTQKWMSQCLTSKGYNKIVLRHQNKSVWKSIHRLVAETYLPNPHNLPQVNHKDGNKLNNSVSNLEWCNNQKNRSHAVHNNLFYHQHYHYVIEHIPTKTIHATQNLSTWCKENNLKYDGLCRTQPKMKGTKNYRPTHKKYRILERWPL